MKTSFQQAKSLIELYTGDSWKLNRSATLLVQNDIAAYNFRKAKKWLFRGDFDGIISFKTKHVTDEIK